MSTLSVRFRSPGTHERLRRHAAARSESVSGAGERLIEEGLRMAAHPGIVFRDGSAGRRAALPAGPDVWEIVGLLRGLRGSVENRLAKAAGQLALDVAQVRAAASYYAEFPGEIHGEIAWNEEAADRELEAWEAERRLLSG